LLAIGKTAAEMLADAATFEAAVKRIKLERGDGGLFFSTRSTGPQSGTF